MNYEQNAEQQNMAAEMQTDEQMLLASEQPDEDQPTPGQLDPAKARDYITAGNAVMTFVNTETGNRFTYKVVKPEGKPWFVRVRTRPGDDRNAWTLLGMIYSAVTNPMVPGTFKRPRKMRVKPDDQALRTFEWLWLNLDHLPETIEIWHEGRCLRCGRRLTDPESITRGYGPVCAERGV